MKRFILPWMFIAIGWFMTDAATAAAADPTNLSNLVVGSCMAIPTLIAMWLGVRFSRWLHVRFGWAIVPYLLSNTVVAMGIVLLSVSVAGAMIDSRSQEVSLRNDVAVILFLAGFFAGIGWLLRSVWRLGVFRNTQRTGIHWRLITSGTNATGLSPQSKSGTHRMSAKKQKRRDKTPSTIFRSVSPSGSGVETPRGVPIPKRNAPPPPQQTSPPRTSKTSRKNRDVFIPAFNLSVSYSTPRSDFVEQAKRYVNRSGRKTEHVPFMQYWPTYDSMSDAQQKWYFYWRSQLRQGNPLPTDTSYLFVHVYEVLNLVGFSSPRAALRHLVSLWRHYRVLQPKLDNYLIDWLADFLVVYKLPENPLRWYGIALQEGAFSGDIDLSVEAWLETGGDFKTLPSKLLYKLAGYSPVRSKFFRAHSDEYQLENAYRQGLQAIEDKLRLHGNSLFDMYRPAQTRIIRREPFAGALHNLPSQAINIATVHPWTSREDLGVTLTAIIKYSENIKRTQSDYSSKLRGIELTDEWKQILDQSFTIPEPRREIAIDMDKVARLKEESQEVRERLIVDDNEAFDTQQATYVEDQGPEPDMSVTVENVSQPGYVQRPDETPDELLTDLPEVAAVMGEAGQFGSRVLDFLKSHAWEIERSSIPTKLFEGSFLSTELDRLNERSARFLGDALVFEENGQVVVAEDYRDEIEFILEHPEYSAAVSVDANSSVIYDVLNDDWAEFAHQMQNHHWEALAALVGGVEVNVRLDAIARSAFATKHQLIDEINEFAMDSVGDIVVDTETEPPQIEDEDIEGINTLLAWASQTVLLEGRNE